MKSPIVFRAEFQQPKNSPMRIAARIGVELYHVAIGPPAEWRARVPGAKIAFKDIAGQGSPATLKRQISDIHFEKQLTEWQAFDSRQEPPRLLEKYDWYEDKDGKVFLTNSYLDKLKDDNKRAAEKRIEERKRAALTEWEDRML
jgi:hypothetical protein